MTTVTRHRLSYHAVHLPLEGPRRIAAALVALGGVVLIALTFANNLFTVGPNFDTMMDGFRPHLTNAAIAQSRSDIQGLGAAGTELQTKMLPAMAQQLRMTPAQFSAYVAQSYPQVSTGMQSLPGIVTTFDGLITTLDQQRPLFRSADAIPTKDIPASSMPWALAGLGAVLVLAGGTLWFRPRVGAIAAVSVGILVIAASFAMTLPQKASDADQLNANLKPVYTAGLVAQAQGALTTVGAMGTQLQTTMLPALATQLKMTPTQLQQFLGQSFPATAAALGNLPQAMPRFQGLVSTFKSNLGNYDTLKPVSFEPIIWTMLGVGLVVALSGAFTLFWPRQRVVHIR